MMASSKASRFAGLTKLVTTVVVVALIVAVAIAVWPSDGQKYLTVNFKRTTALYEGSDVKILGVPVGTVESITPKGETVKVVLAYDDKFKLPDDVEAAIITPALVGGRFVQLAPVYTGGPALPDHATLGVDRAHVPIELDEVFGTLDDLAVALGPEGANADGSLSKLVNATAGLLEGQGQKLHETIKNFAKLSTTLSNNKEELFGSIDEVEQFVSVLKENDSTVREFNDSTAQVAKVLEAQRDDLAGVLKNLSLALIDVKGLVKENRSAVRANVDDLTEISKTLAKNVDSIREATRSAPTALANVAFTYNQKYGTLDTRVDALQLIGNLPNALCNVISQQVEGLCDILAPVLDLIPNLGDLLGGKLNPSDLLPGLPSLSRTAAASAGNNVAGSNVAGAAPATQHVQHSLQEMLGVN